MASIQIPDEDYQALSVLARERGLNPERFVLALLEEHECADQIAFQGEDIKERVQRQMAELEASPRRYLTEEGFFAELESRAAKPAKDQPPKAP